MKISGAPESVKPNGEAAVSSIPVNSAVPNDVSSGDVGLVKSKVPTPASSTPVKPTRKLGASPGLKIGVSVKPRLPSCAKGKAIVSDDLEEVIPFKNLTLGPHEAVLRFRLIHFWEAWNSLTKVLIGLELLLIDEEGTVVQGFIPYGKIQTYKRHLKAGATYRLNNFFGSKNKPNYRVFDGDVTVSFSWNSVLSPLEDSTMHFPGDRFRVHGYKEFDAACEKKGDLYDYIGHIRLVNEEVPTGSFQLDEARVAGSRRIDLHVQTHDEPVLKVCLWDNAAFEFCEKFKASGCTARSILVTTLNPKRFGVLTLSSMTSSRVFLDDDIQETRDYLGWYNSNKDVANGVIANVVVKPEPATLGDLLALMKQPSAKVGWFECTATIDDVVHGSKWYYIGCGGCHTKATIGPTTLMCKKCGKNEIVGVPQYLSKLSVYDHQDQAMFVVLGDAGEELFGKKAAELVESYYEENDDASEDDLVPVPQAMVDTIGQTRRFIVKMSSHNLTAKTQTLTVTKVLPIEALDPEANVGDNVDVEPDNEGGEDGAESLKRVADGVESEASKRAKCG